MIGAILDILMLSIMAFFGCIFMLKDLLVTLTRTLYKEIVEYYGQNYEQCNWISKGEDKDEV